MSRTAKTYISLFLSLFVTYQLCAQNSTREFKRIKAQRIIQIKKDYYLLRLDINVPMFSLPLQKYLASEMFKSKDPLLVSAVNEFIAEHELDEEIKNKVKIDTLDFELTCVSYKPSKYISMFIHYPYIYTVEDVSEEAYVVKDRIYSFVFDLKREKVLSYHDVFNTQYNNLLVSGNSSVITNVSQTNGYSFELDDDFLSYGNLSYIRLPLCQTKEYFTPEFQRIIDWDVVEHRADSLNLKGLAIKEMLEQKAQQNKAYNDSLEKERLIKLAKEYIAYRKDENPYVTIHLYMKDDECWVSGLNKNIYELTETDIQLLSRKSKWIMNEITVIKQVMEQQKGSAGIDKIYTIEKLLAAENCKSGIPRITQQANYRNPQKLDYISTLIHITNYVKKHLSYIHSTVLVRMSFAVDEEGHIICPVVTYGEDIDVNKEIVRILRKFDNCPPFRLNNIPVKVWMDKTFSYELRRFPTD